MQAVNYSTARNNLKSIIEDIDSNGKEYLVVTKEDRQVVIISYDEYQSMKETLYLLSTPANSERLLWSIGQIEKSKFQRYKLIDP
ncbi:MAG TPA: type II toxin-antitoxin system prevent-host-death family antitoxin [Candidatus Ozemobacteraceae bacterium]|nr:type II toxin-antitoxin system prevent-host-death family antitoxin [Candidatus Ozemobacteraceae bacterium]